MEKQEHEYRPFPGPVRTRAVAAARRRQLAGTCVQVCRWRTVLRPARRRAAPVRCRRQPLHRLRRFMGADDRRPQPSGKSEEHTSELQSLMRISYAVFCLKKKINKK